jgi:hypothetical protein
MPVVIELVGILCMRCLLVPVPSPGLLVTLAGSAVLTLGGIMPAQQHTRVQHRPQAVAAWITAPTLSTCLAACCL